MITNTWTKIKRERGLYRYNPSGQYFARVRFKGRLIRRKLDTDDLALAKRKLRAFRDDLERTDATKGNTSFAVVLDNYAAALTGARSTLKIKNAVVAKLKQTLFGCDSLPLRSLKPSALSGWLSKHYGSKSASAFNQAVCVVRDACALAVKDRIVLESPAKDLRYRRPSRPIRDVPTEQQFRAIINDIRSQKFNHGAEESADFIALLGLCGLGQIEAASIKRSDVDLSASRIVVYRHKTDVGYVIPIYPWARALVEKLCADKKPHQRLFSINESRKALSSACQRQGFVRELPDGRLVAQFTHRSFRRMFATICLQRGIDPQTVSIWLGHRDGGRLVLSVYGHVQRPHVDRMAALLTDSTPENVVPITAAKA